MTRVCAVGDPAQVSDPEYAAGLETLVSATVGFAIEAIGQAASPPVPLPLYPQARLAARNGVSIGTVARRYIAGGLALTEFIEQEAAPDLAPSLRQYVWGLVDELVGEADKAYAHELERGAVSREPRRVRLVEELLAGKPVDPGQVAPGFNFDSWQIAAIATDKSAVEAVGWLAKVADRRLMQVRRDEHSVWAWLAGSRKLESTQLQLMAAERLPADGCIAFGEPQEGLSGWQLSHHQAAAALRVGVRRGDRLVHHGEVAKQASMLQDPVFAASLRQRYLVPLSANVT